MTGAAERLARVYRRFAEREARQRSPVYAQVCARIAGEPRMLGFLLELPPAKWQPNLFLGAVQYACGRVPNWPWFRGAFAEHEDEIRAVMRARTTQTNEPARCATLLPALAALPQPLALLEVGASAGLCLLPDRYGYDYGDRLIPGDLLLPCRVNEATPLQRRQPEVVWRAGLDLNPLDVHDPDDCAWLEALIWPGEEGRIPRLHAALALAREDRPPVRRSDLRADFAELAATTPREATLVVFHQWNVARGRPALAGGGIASSSSYKRTVCIVIG